MVAIARRVAAPAPEAVRTDRPSRLLQYLPAIYDRSAEARWLESEVRALEERLAPAPPEARPQLQARIEQRQGELRACTFLRRFLLLLEDLVTPVERILDAIHWYFDPTLAPEDFLPWLASWVDLALDENWPVERRRQLIRSAASLYRWRGTRRGLTEHLRLYTGIVPRIEEHFSGVRLGDGQRLGFDTILGEGTGHTFTVTLEVEDLADLDPQHVRRIIEAEKPAHTGYLLRIVQRGQ